MGKPNVPPVEFEHELFVLVDASGVLPRGDRAYEQRDPRAIRCVVVHQTQGQMKAGLEGMRREAEMFASPPPAGRGWPGYGYTFFVPFRPELREGRPVIYRGQPDNVLSYHTGPKEIDGYRIRGANADGVGVAFQGLFRSRALPEGNQPSWAQLRVFQPFMKWLFQRYSLSVLDLYGHSDYGKADCPGDDLEREIDALRFRSTAPELGSWASRQSALVQLGLLAEGEIDGIYGPHTRLAIERLQAREGRMVTGHWTRHVDSFVRQQLASARR